MEVRQAERAADQLDQQWREALGKLRIQPADVEEYARRVDEAQKERKEAVRQIQQALDELPPGEDVQDTGEESRASAACTAWSASC
ncbi:MAG: hypothetical protein R3F43_13985 [bacterium]